MMATPAPSPSASPNTSPSPRPRPRPRAATYRVQLHAGFTFDDAAGSPATWPSSASATCTARRSCRRPPGSTHGYDVVDHGRLNASWAARAGYRRLPRAADQAGLAQVLDIVPNHMALAGRANAWWWDVLENGPSSVYASYFDIDWDPPQRKLARHRADAGARRPVRPGPGGRGAGRLERQGGSFTVRYYEHEAPISPRTLGDLLATAAARAGSEELESLALAFSRLPHARRTDRAAVAERHRDKEVLRARLADLCRGPARGRRGDRRRGRGAEPRLRRARRPAERAELPAGLLAHRRRGAVLPAVLRHRDAGRAAGGGRGRVRRHPPPDPRRWSPTARWTACGSTTWTASPTPRATWSGCATPPAALYVVVEKILEAGRGAARDLAGGGHLRLRVPQPRQRAVRRLAATRPPCGPATPASPAQEQDYADVVYAAKLQIMREELAAEVERLTGLLADVCERHRRHRDHTRRELREALREMHRGLRRVPHLLPRRAPGHAPRTWRTWPRPSPRPRQRRPDLDAELLQLHRRPDHRRPIPASRGDQLRGAVRPGQRAGHGQGRGGHRVLPLPAADQPQRGGRRPGPVRPPGRRLPPRHGPRGPALAGGDADAVDPRHQAQRRRARQDQRAVGAARSLGERGGPLGGAEQRAQAGRLAGPQRRVPALPDAGRRLADRRGPGRRVHAEGGQGSQGAHLLDRPERRLRRCVVRVRDRGPRRPRLRRRPGRLPGRAPDRRARPGQLPGPDRADADLPGGPRPLPGHRAVGASPWSTRTTAARSTTRARRALLDSLADAGPEAALARAADGGPKLWLIHRVLGHRRRHPGAYGPGSGYEPLHVRGPRIRQTWWPLRAAAGWPWSCPGWSHDVDPRMGGHHGRAPAGRRGPTCSPATPVGRRPGRRGRACCAGFPSPSWAGTREPSRLGEPGRRPCTSSGCGRLARAAWTLSPAGSERADAAAAVAAGGRVPSTDAGPGTDYAFSLDGGPARPDPRSAFQPGGHRRPVPGGRPRGLRLDRRRAGAGLPLAGVGPVRVPRRHLLGRGDLRRGDRAPRPPGRPRRRRDRTAAGRRVLRRPRGWGYDGVDLFAPHHAYGGPDGLKRLVDAAHARGPRRGDGRRLQPPRPGRELPARVRAVLLRRGTGPTGARPSTSTGRAATRSGASSSTTR